MNSSSSLYQCEFDSDYFVARRLQREEETMRLQEEEANLQALTKFLMEEEMEEKRRMQSELEDSHKVALEFQKQWEQDAYFQRQREEEENFKLAQQLQADEQREEEESFKLAQKMQAYEEEREKQEREKQEYEDERLAAKMMLMEEERYCAVHDDIKNDNDDNNKDNNKDWTYALKVHKKERMSAMVKQMFQEHAKFERIAKRRSNESMITEATEEENSDYSF